MHTIIRILFEDESDDKGLNFEFLLFIGREMFNFSNLVSTILFDFR